MHGLLPELGIHHLGKYNSTPLVYDLMEPYRPFVDLYIEKIVESYLQYDCSNIFLPHLKEQYLHIDKHKNRETEYE